MSLSPLHLPGAVRGASFALRKNVAPLRSRWIFNPLVNRALRLQRGDRAEWLAAVRTGMGQFPEMKTRDRGADLRRLVLQDAANRVVFRLQTRLPVIARTIARFVPVAGPVRSLSDVPQDRPIVLALTHFGPIHFVFTVLRRFLGNRTIYAFHAGGDTAEAAARYLRSLGVIPLVSGEKSLRVVARAMVGDPHCAVVIGFDYLATRGRRPLPFLGVPIFAGRGLAYLADAHDAVVVPASGEWTENGLRIEVAPALKIDRALAPGKRQEMLNAQLFSLLEARVRNNPSGWTEWHNCPKAS